MSPVVFPHAVAALLAPTVTSESPRGWQQTVRIFLDEYFAQHGDKSKWLFDADQGRRFLKLQAKVHRFIKDMTKGYVNLLYTDEAEGHASYPETNQFSEQARTNKLALPSQHPLTTTELARMERAFYRFELYSRCFPVDPKRSERSLISAEDQARLFINRLKGWEVEEMSCVHQYFESRLDNLVSKWEEEIVSKVRHNKVQRPSPKCHPPEALWFYRAVELQGLDLYSERQYTYRDCRLLYILSLGLDVLNGILFAASEQEQLDLFRSQNSQWRDRDFLSEALHSSRDGSTTDFQESCQIGDKDDRTSYANAGWRRFRQPSFRPYLPLSVSGKSHWATKQLGYIFWDDERLRNKEVERKLHAASRPRPSSEEDMEMPNPEKRLKGIPFPRRIMNEIIRDYASSVDTSAIIRCYAWPVDTFAININKLISRLEEESQSDDWFWEL